MRSLCVFLFVVLAASFSGCGPGNDSGTLHLVVTDAPFPYDNIKSATVTLTSIEARGSAENNGFITLSSQTQTIDLTLLRNGITLDLAMVEVPAGDYDEVRLVVSGGQVTLTDNTVFDLKVPSGAESGIKVKVSPAIHVETSLTSDLLLDFNLARSFKPQSSSHGISGFHFDPVVRASNLTTAGTIAGTVGDGMGTSATADDIAMESATVAVSQNGSEITQAATDANGQYRIIGLPAGIYDLSVEADGYVTHSVTSLNVVAGNLTTANAVLQPEGLTVTTTLGSPAGGNPTSDGLYGAPEHLHLGKGYSRPTGGGSSPVLSYRGGDVLNAHKTMAIFWGSQWNSASFAGDKINGLDQLFSNFNGSRYASTGNEYYDNINGAGILYVTAASAYLGHLIDATTAPSKALTTTSAVAEACKITGNNPDPNALYLIYTATGAGHVNYCAWHSWGTCSNGAKIQVAYMPNLDGISGCDPVDNVTGHSQGLAALANVTMHELMEAVTDPRGTGWVDNSGNENADKCAWSFAPVDSSNPKGVSTMADGSIWKVQMEWSNAAYDAGTGYLNRSGQAACIY